MKRKSIILLSGGLDSLVSLGIAKEEYNIELALTFDYGQNPAKREIQASKKIAENYGIEHETISLPFLNEITKNSFVGGEYSVSNTEFGTNASMKSVWVPNRNGLFLNIAAAIADAKNYTHIVFGANKTEAKTFSDNTKEFVLSINNEFKYSTMNGVEVVAPLIDYDKIDIVRFALEQNIPLELAYSCYRNGEKNCGKCESCNHLKKALEANKAYNYIERLF